MSIHHVLLGLLSAKPLTGYDIKKKMQDIPFMHWSGNNNQIYKTLLQLREQGYVVYEVQHQDGAPSKKIYSITEPGLEWLKQWVKSAEIEILDGRHTFLIQLIFSGLLESEEQRNLFSAFRKNLEIQKQMLLEQQRRKEHYRQLPPRDRLLWEAAYQNLILSCQQNLDWLQETEDRCNVTTEG